MPVKRVGRVGIATIAAVVGVAVGVPASTVARQPTIGALPGARAHVFAVGVRTEAFVDRARPTPANGAYPGSPSRALPTIVLYPARGKARRV